MWCGRGFGFGVWFGCVVVGVAAGRVGRVLGGAAGVFKCVVPGGWVVWGCWFVLVVRWGLLVVGFYFGVVGCVCGWGLGCVFFG